MVDDLDEQLVRQEIAADRVMIAGHSMGAVLAWRLAERACDRGVRPRALFLSGRGGPGIPRRRANLHDLPRREFVERLREFGGSPAEVVENGEMMDLLEPILRADFRSLELAPRFAVRPLPVPVTVVIGADDTVTREDAEAWRLITSKGCALHVQAGGHFHLLEEAHATAGLMAAGLHHTTRISVP
jgi:surfactin synthase thioesterase subunit